jgi:hypothetical protein
LLASQRTLWGWIDWIGGDIGGINVSRGMNSGAKGALDIVEDIFFGHGN